MVGKTNEPSPLSLGLRGRASAESPTSRVKAWTPPGECRGRDRWRRCHEFSEYAERALGERGARDSDLCDWGCTVIGTHVFPFLLQEKPHNNKNLSLYAQKNAWKAINQNANVISEWWCYEVFSLSSYCLSIFSEFSVMNIHYFCNKKHWKEDRGSGGEQCFWADEAGSFWLVVLRWWPHGCFEEEDGQSSGNEFVSLVKMPVSWSGLLVLRLGEDLSFD